MSDEDELGGGGKGKMFYNNNNWLDLQAKFNNNIFQTT